MPSRTFFESSPADTDMFTQALIRWRNLLGDARVLSDDYKLASYVHCTTPVCHAPKAALLLENVDEIKACVIIAAECRVPIYPISTGNNWGYGSTNSEIRPGVILDLARLNRVIDVDSTLGLVTIEPGVTQLDLRSYFDKHDLPFLVPVTGAGPTCSLLGNALERGYGITPVSDHFSAVMSLEAVMPDGQIYRSALSELGGQSVDQAYKWGLGPYFDGMFTQGCFGVVTQMTLALARKPERIEAFFFFIKKDIGLEPAVSGIQEILTNLGGIAGGINLLNTRRVLAMTVPYPGADPATGLIPENKIAEVAKRHRIMAWTGVGGLYGDTRVVKAARLRVKEILRPYVDRLVFVNERSIGRVNRSLPFIPWLRRTHLANTVRAIDSTLQIMAGCPSEVALPLAYWKSGRSPQVGVPMNPARDNCGLIWYAPLVPMRVTEVRAFVTMVEKICREYGMEPLITLTSQSNRCFDCSIPLLFNKDSADESARAQACYGALFAAGQRLGFLPYRLGVNAMGQVTGLKAPYWDIIRRVKLALDPDDIISPGRYCPPNQPSV